MFSSTIHRRTRWVAASAAAAALLLLSVAGPADAARRSRQRGAVAQTAQPNIVFVLTDDLSWDLVDYMPEVQRLQRDGVTFSDYTVTNSLCCPSRASILTGRYPHNTGIYRNTGVDGGFRAFRARGEESATFATALQGAGYGTALLGKYMNQYAPGKIRAADGGLYVPPGWSTWGAAGNGYPGYGYRIMRDDQVAQRGWAARDYLTSVIQRDGSRFVADSVAAGQPFMLEVSTFTPHTPSTPAPRDEWRFEDVTAPRPPSFDEDDVSDKPGWVAALRRLTPAQEERIDAHFRERVRSVQSVDRALGQLRAQLQRLGVADNTYVVFSSDNGFHLGQHRMTPGKLTPYDADIRVPLIVAGPGVPAGSTVDALAENVDLCPTFAELGGAAPPSDVDGRSLVPLLHGQTVGGWREASLVEHRNRGLDRWDPDFPGRGSPNPPTYEALRLRDGLYVEYATGEREYYDHRTDPHELENVVDELPATQLDRLSSTIAAMKTCSGIACREAARMGTESPLP